MDFMLWAMGLSAYSTVDEYISGAVRSMSAPFRASEPVCLMNSATLSPACAPYILENDSRAYARSFSSSMSGKRPYVSRFPTDATGTPLA